MVRAQDGPVAAEIAAGCNQSVERATNQWEGGRFTGNRIQKLIRSRRGEGRPISFQLCDLIR